MTSGVAKRVAFFAHFDRDHLVDDYVLYYLQGLREVCDEIIFVSACNLDAQEIAKLDGLAVCASAADHDEYDFGSWKRALQYLGGSLRQFDELVLANDSCYGPIIPFTEMFSAMSAVDCDFWSQTACKERYFEWDEKYRHGDSYFMVFKKSVLESNLLEDFLSDVAAEGHKDDIVLKYELGLSRLLIEAGIKLAAYTGVYTSYACERGWFLSADLFEKRCPIVKVRALRVNPHFAARVSEVVARIGQNYPAHLIIDHGARVGPDSEFRQWFLPVDGKRYRLLSKYFLELRVKYKSNCRWLAVTVRLARIPIFFFIWPINVRGTASRLQALRS